MKPPAILSTFQGAEKRRAISASLPFHHGGAVVVDQLLSRLGSTTRMKIEVLRAVILLSRCPKAETRSRPVPNAGSIDNENGNWLQRLALGEHADSTLKRKAGHRFGQRRHKAKEIMPAASTLNLGCSHF